MLHPSLAKCFTGIYWVICGSVNVLIQCTVVVCGARLVKKSSGLADGGVAQDKVGPNLVHASAEGVG